jgi:hypothetical protein
VLIGPNAAAVSVATFSSTVSSSGESSKLDESPSPALTISLTPPHWSLPAAVISPSATMTERLHNAEISIELQSCNQRERSVIRVDASICCF